jgi:hypothetical protein
LFSPVKAPLAIIVIRLEDKSLHVFALKRNE